MPSLSHTEQLLLLRDCTQAKVAQCTLLSSTPQHNRLHTSHTAGFPPWPLLLCWQDTISEHTGRVGSSAFRGSSQDGACGVWISSVCSRPEHNWKEGRSDHHSQDLRNLLLLSQRPYIKQRFPEWYTIKSKPLIQSCRSAAVQAKESLQQNPGLWRTANSNCRFSRLKTICPLHEFLHTSVL